MRRVGPVVFSLATPGRHATLPTSTNRQNAAGLAANSASIQAAALNLSRTEIRAPLAARISRSQAFEGSLISVAGATLNTLVQFDPIYVSFNPAEADVEAISRVQARSPIATSVSVGADGKAEQREVELGDSHGDMIVVTEGLKVGKW